MRKTSRNIAQQKSRCLHFYSGT